MAPKYDILVWGATGYSGRLVSRYLSRAAAAKGLTWAVAGRSEEKLARLQDELGGRRAEGVVVGDAGSQRQVDEAVAQAGVVIAAAGPYSLVGTPVVESCVRHRTAYVDVNGEVPWVRKMVDGYDEAARDHRTTLIPGSGFSVPSDVGAFFAAAEHLRRHGEKPDRIRAYYNHAGQLSGGTVHTGLVLQESGFGALRAMADPFLLGGRPAGGKPRAHEADMRAAGWSDEAASHTGPFFMAPISSRIVRRSFELFKSADPDRCPYAYPSDSGVPSYTECAVAPSEAAARALVSAKLSAAERKKLVPEGKLFAPGTGPSDAALERGSFSVDVFSQGASHTGRIRIEGGDAYLETARFVSEAAMLLANGEAEAYGFVTPSFAFGHKYVTALRESGLTFRSL
ncbi:putative trans-acting enoyl reductase [Diplonema papillatum]|nr:putative trans-acting enoyl reductase [Diplonema papillatum]